MTIKIYVQITKAIQIGIPITDHPVNFGAKQIIISQVDSNPAEPSVVRLFEKKQRILLQNSKTNYEKEIVKFIKEYTLKILCMNNLLLFYIFRKFLN